jgi:predicted secreted protein
MKKIILVSHCVLNSYCELPQGPEVLRKDIVKTLIDKGISIVQLPCPELCYQGLERSSIYPGTEEEKEYTQYCQQLLVPIIGNMREYHKEGIKIIGIIGIDTSPSCSAINPSSIMMKIILDEIKKAGITVDNIFDMPVHDYGIDDFMRKMENL